MLALQITFLAVSICFLAYSILMFFRLSIPDLKEIKVWKEYLSDDNFVVTYKGEDLAGCRYLHVEYPDKENSVIVVIERGGKPYCFMTTKNFNELVMTSYQKKWSRRLAEKIIDKFQKIAVFLHH